MGRIFVRAFGSLSRCKAGRRNRNRGHDERMFDKVVVVGQVMLQVCAFFRVYAMFGWELCMIPHPIFLGALRCKSV